MSDKEEQPRDLKRLQDRFGNLPDVQGSRTRSGATAEDAPAAAESIPRGASLKRTPQKPTPQNPPPGGIPRTPVSGIGRGRPPTPLSATGRGRGSPGANPFESTAIGASSARFSSRLSAIPQADKKAAVEESVSIEDVDKIVRLEPESEKGDSDQQEQWSSSSDEMPEEDEFVLTRDGGDDLTVTLKPGKMEDFKKNSALYNTAVRRITNETQEARLVYEKPAPNSLDLLTLKDSVRRLTTEFATMMRLAREMKAMVIRADLSKYQAYTNKDIHKIQDNLGLANAMLEENNIDITDFSQLQTNATLGAGAAANVTLGPNVSATTTSRANRDRGPRNDESISIMFKGTKVDYARYKMEFMDLVGDHSEISAVTKFRHLKLSLPPHIIPQLGVYLHDDDGFKKFWDYMDQTYASKSDGVWHWLNEMKRLPYVQEKNGIIKSYQFHNFYLKANEVIAKLSELGMTGSDNHLTWNATLSNKLPFSMAMKWNVKYREIKNKVGEDPVAAFLQFVEAEVNNCRDVANNYKNDPPPPKDKNGSGNGTGNGNKNGQKQEQVYLAHDGGAKKNPPSGGPGATVKSTNPDHCYLCSKGDKKEKHHPRNCPSPYKTDAFKRCYKAGACISCLNLQHRSDKCPQKVVCGIDNCTFRHNRKLHGCTYISSSDYKQQTSGNK